MTKKIIEGEENPSEYEWNRPSTNKMVKGKLDPYDIIFKSMPRIGVRSPLAGIWPECAKRDKVSKPVIFEIEFGYLVEAGFGDDYELPTVREYDYEDLSRDEALDYFKDLCEGDGITADVEEEIGSPIDKWTKQNVEYLESYFSYHLDSSVDPDKLGRYSLAIRSKYGLAILVHDRIGSDLAEKMNLFLVDGEHPGSDFIGVNYTGSDTEALNHWFAKTGLNMIVTE